MDDPSIISNSIASKKPKTSILIVDDEPGVLCSLSHVISHFFADALVETALSAEESIELAQDIKFELVISDFKLPEMSGIELIRNLGELQPDAKKILISGYCNDEITDLAKSAGCDGFLAKPFEVSDLIEVVNKVLVGEQEKIIPGFEISGIDFERAIQIFAWNDEVSVLEILSGTFEGMLVVKNGHLVFAKAGEEVGVDALLTFLSLENGKIRLLDAKAPQERNCKVPWHVFVSAHEAIDTEERKKILLQEKSSSYPHKSCVVELV